MLKRFLKFLVSSLSATLIDLIVFTILRNVLEPFLPTLDIAAATIIARVVSATYNCAINYKLVFASHANVKRVILRFALLALCIVCASAVLVTIISELLPQVSPTIIKMAVDAMLFFVNYTIQQRWVFVD